MESYVEHPPLPGLAGVVRTVWIQRTGEAAYAQRHLPTGGIEIHFPIGGHPQLVGPLTGPELEVIPAHTTIVGVRFQPGPLRLLQALPCYPQQAATSSLTLLDSFKTRRRAAHSVELVPDLAEFGQSLDGELFSPDSPGYEAIRRPVNLAYREARPRLVVACRSVSDVVGAITYATATATAFAHRGERFLLEHIADAADPWVDRSWATAHADGSGRVYPNFPDPALDDWPATYHAGNYPRLAAVKNAYDPHRFFAFPQAI